MDSKRLEVYLEAQIGLLRMIVKLLLLYVGAHDKHYCLDTVSESSYYTELRHIDAALQKARDNQGATNE